MTLPIRALPSVAHPEAMDWRARVIANGGTADGLTMSAVSRFSKRIDAIGVRDRFWRLNLLCGDGLEAVLVPLYRAESRTAAVRGNETDTNNSFVSGDFNNTGSSSGLKGNGTSKYLSTGVNANTLTAANSHLGIGLRATDTRAAAYRTAIGAYAFGSNSFEIALHDLNGKNYSAYFSRFGTPSDCCGDSIGPVAGPLAAGDIIAAWPSMYRNGAATGATATTSQDYTATTSITVFALGGTLGNITNARMSWYSIGLTMTAAQALAFYNAIAEFNTALSRT